MAHALDVVTLGVEVIKQLAVGIISSGEHRTAVLMDIHKGKSIGFCGNQSHCWCSSIVFRIINDFGQEEAQPVKMIFCHFGNDAVIT